MSRTGSPPSQTHLSPAPGHIEGGHSSPNYNHRRGPSSTGGGRAWSEEEENYLIETRQHKMPYKHIAARLQKTELACRLHYHQLSFGTKRRRRTSSVSSVRSAASNHSPERHMIPQQRPLPALSPPDSPESAHRASTRSSSPHHPVPILPRPVANPQPILQPGNALRLITQDIEKFEERSRIDRDRLAQVYAVHRHRFWEAVARDYGDNASPAVLEDVWRRSLAGAGGTGSTYPPTPPNRSSPSSPDPNSNSDSTSTSQGQQQQEQQQQRPRHQHAMSTLKPPFTEGALPNVFNPVNATPRPRSSSSSSSRSAQSTPCAPPRSSFAISSLLTENKEVRTSPKPPPATPR